jgi:hypothetical protein
VLVFNYLLILKMLTVDFKLFLPPSSPFVTLFKSFVVKKLQSVREERKRVWVE